MGFITRQRKTYATISDGLLRIKSSQDNHEAVKREVRNPQTNEMITKWELVFDEYSGKLSDIRIVDGKFTRQLELEFLANQGEQPVIIQMNTNSKNGGDVLRRLPNMNLNWEFILVPYKFTDDKGVTRQGVTIKQAPKDTDEKTAKEKVADFFKDKEGKTINGLPEWPENYQELNTNKKQMFKASLEEALVEYVQKEVVDKFEATSFNVQDAEVAPIDVAQEPSEDEISVDQIPM